MQLVLFNIPPESVKEEIRTLVQSTDADAWMAGLDFFTALKQMRAKKQLRAQPLQPNAYMALLGPNESMWKRARFHHTLYLTRINSISTGPVEVRAVLACNGAEPEHKRINKAAERHHKM